MLKWVVMAHCSDTANFTARHDLQPKIAQLQTEAQRLRLQLQAANDALNNAQLELRNEREDFDTELKALKRQVKDEQLAKAAEMSRVVALQSVIESDRTSRTGQDQVLQFRSSELNTLKSKYQALLAKSHASEELKRGEHTRMCCVNHHHRLLQRTSN